MFKEILTMGGVIKKFRSMLTTDKTVTQSGVWAADAASLKEVNDKIPFSFGIDEDGNYGYKKAGADTVYPFKSGVKITRLAVFNASHSRRSDWQPVAFNYSFDVKPYLANYDSYTKDDFVVTPYYGCAQSAISSSWANFGVSTGSITSYSNGILNGNYATVHGTGFPDDGSCAWQYAVYCAVKQ